MNKLKMTCLAAAFALVGAGVAQAQTYIYLTGATACRAQTYTAVTNLMAGTQKVVFIGSAGGANGASYVTIRGTISGTDTIVKCSWSGSAAGVQTVGSTSYPISTYLADSLLPGSPSESAISAGSAVYDAPTLPNAAFSDVLKSTTPFGSGALSQQTSVGIVTFMWVCSTNAPAGMTNMTPQLARAQFLNDGGAGPGTMRASMYTGNAADSNIFVYATGRDGDSGTRLTAFAEAGLGADPQVTQYNVSTGAIYTNQVVNGVAFDNGKGGEASGGTLGDKISLASTNGAGKVYVTYLTLADATKSGKINKKLMYNGAVYSSLADTNNVIEGKYTFWTNEQLYYRSGFSGTAKLRMDDIAAKVRTLTVDIPKTGMNVSRSGDGTVITHK